MVHKFKCRCFKMTPNLFLNIPTAEYKAQGTLRCVNGTYRCVNAISKIPEVRKRRLPSTTALIVMQSEEHGAEYTTHGVEHTKHGAEHTTHGAEHTTHGAEHTK